MSLNYFTWVLIPALQRTSINTLRKFSVYRTTPTFASVILQGKVKPKIELKEITFSIWYSSNTFKGVLFWRKKFSSLLIHFSIIFLVTSFVHSMSTLQTPTVTWLSEFQVMRARLINLYSLQQACLYINVGRSSKDF